MRRAYVQADGYPENVQSNQNPADPSPRYCRRPCTGSNYHTFIIAILNNIEDEERALYNKKKSVHNTEGVQGIDMQYLFIFFHF